VTGSTARALLGSGERPNDLDIEVACADAKRSAGALGLTLARDTSNGRVSNRALGRFARSEIDLSSDVVDDGSPDDDPRFTLTVRVSLGRVIVPLRPSGDF
jgi:hypothetical protein